MDRYTTFLGLAVHFPVAGSWTVQTLHCALKTTNLGPSDPLLKSQAFETLITYYWAFSWPRMEPDLLNIQDHILSPPWPLQTASSSLALRAHPWTSILIPGPSSPLPELFSRPLAWAFQLLLSHSELHMVTKVPPMFLYFRPGPSGPLLSIEVFNTSSLIIFIDLSFGSSYRD